MCSIGIGHADCILSQRSYVEHLSHKADSESWKRTKSHAYKNKIRQQRINKNENKEYYQNSTEWHSPSSESEITKRRKI